LHDFKRIALHWIQQHYGHLRQGLRLLTSSCDFLQMQHCPSRFWQLALPCLGMMEDIAPNGRVRPTTCDEREAARSQPTPLITSRKHLPCFAEEAASVLRSAPLRPTVTFLELLMEPLFYNPNINGRRGARRQMSPSCESRRTTVHPRSGFTDSPRTWLPLDLHTSSTSSRALPAPEGRYDASPFPNSQPTPSDSDAACRLPRSQQSFQRLLDGITTQPAWMHALQQAQCVHLLKGLTSSRGALRLLTFPELAAHAQRLGRRLPPAPVAAIIPAPP
jgi:hypothetical protein